MTLPRRWLTPLYAARRLAVRAAAPALNRYRRRYWGLPAVRFAPMPEARPRPLEGYPDRLAYRPGQSATFHLRSPYAANTLVVERASGPGRFEAVARVAFGHAEQRLRVEAPAAGCGWAPTCTVAIDERFSTGYYRARIEADGAPPDEVEGSAITFLVQPAAPRHRVAVVAPVGTWIAYNPWGGQSLYHNEHEQLNTYVVSAARPNPALGWDAARSIHAMAVESHVFHWLHTEVGADLYPDHVLETPGALDAYDLLVLAYHTEYVSDAMHAGLRRWVEGGRSLLSLGGNALYWRTRWLPGFAGVECRKDTTPFADGRGRGGLWRHTRYPEEALLGVRFTAPGTGTYAPYRVTAPGHWLYDGLDVSEGQVFGVSGITPYPICGDETDEPGRLAGLAAEVVARGLNRAEAVDGAYTVYREADPAWDGSAGGTIALTPRSGRHAVLATGAIHSGSGLGVDPVFTGLVRNFLRRYLPAHSA